MSAEIVARLYADVVSPLVLGGALRPGRIIGGAAALELGKYASAVDADLRSRTDLGRTRIARALLPVDVLPEASDRDWILFASLHDWLAAASPELSSLVSPRAAARALDLVAGTLGHVPPPRNAHEALSRHTFMSRLLSVHRNDVRVSFWAGARHFLGTKPPERLLAWPDLRRVRTETTPRPLWTLAAYGAHVDGERWLAQLERMLRLSPLTDIANAARDAPTFAWSRETLGLIATHTGRTLTLRALAPQRVDEVLVALGRATRLLSIGQAWRGVGVVAELLSALVLRLALDAPSGEWSRIVTAASGSPDLFFGLGIGAIAAENAASRELSPSDATAALTRVMPVSRSDEARALLPGT